MNGRCNLNIYIASAGDNVSLQPYILPRAQSIIEKQKIKFDFDRLLRKVDSDELSTDNIFYNASIIIYAGLQSTPVKLHATRRD